MSDQITFPFAKNVARVSVIFLGKEGRKGFPLHFLYENCAGDLSIGERVLCDDGKIGTVASLNPRSSKRIEGSVIQSVDRDALITNALSNYTTLLQKKECLEKAISALKKISKEVSNLLSEIQ